jgi:hypothetical protein
METSAACIVCYDWKVHEQYISINPWTKNWGLYLRLIGITILGPPCQTIGCRSCSCQMIANRIALASRNELPDRDAGIIVGVA